MKRLFYTHQAQKDLERGFQWYEEQRRGLGLEWLDCIEASLHGILRFPEASPKIYGLFRRNVVRRFPFSIFYVIEDEQIVVHAIFDNRQNPSRQPE